MAHIIILGAISELQGCLPTIEALEAIQGNPEAELTEAQTAVMNQAEAIAGSLPTQTAALAELIGYL